MHISLKVIAYLVKIKPVIPECYYYYLLLQLLYQLWSSSLGTSPPSPKCTQHQTKADFDQCHLSFKMPFQHISLCAKITNNLTLHIFVSSFEMYRLYSNGFPDKAIKKNHQLSCFVFYFINQYKLFFTFQILKTRRHHFAPSRT